MFLISKFSLDMMSDMGAAFSVNIYPISKERARVAARDCINFIDNAVDAGILGKDLGDKDIHSNPGNLVLGQGDMCLFGQIKYNWLSDGGQYPTVKWFLVEYHELPDDQVIYADHDNDEV